MSHFSDRCEECGMSLSMGARKRIGKRGWCSQTCLVKAGIVPKPERKVIKHIKPRLPVFKGEVTV